MPRDVVLIVDFGSQTTQLIARRIRELNVYCEIHPYTRAVEAIEKLAPKAIVLSGGPASVYGEAAPFIDVEALPPGVPVLGICYGLQLLAHRLGGRVERGGQGEYGRAGLRVDRASPLFGRLAQGVVESREADAAAPSRTVWMSHGDHVVELPPGFVAIASNEVTAFSVVEHADKRIWGLQFHPEVSHTTEGRELLAAFVLDIAGCAPDFTPAAFIDEATAAIAARVGPSERAILGLSGGVDSTVAAALCKRALGDRLQCIFVDNGLLRANEGDDVMRFTQVALGLSVTRVDAAERFLSALEGETDPEKKRKIIGRVFIEVFEEEAKKVSDAKYLVQGTLYPDVIESVSIAGHGTVIKSHHNVGGLPERMNLKLVEPLRELFKDEVREVGRALGVSEAVLGRHPFPGPGLAVRCLGPLLPARLATLRAADAIFEDEIRRAGIYGDIWQAFAVLLPVRTVGVMGDARTYDEVIALRAVESTDGMTADWSRIPYDVVARASSRIINEVRGVNRVVLDVSSKPPATIEWE